MPSRVDLESMQLLVAIDTHASLGAAARSLGISQPAASARLRALEARYRLSLVARSARGSRLTEDGQAICAWSRAVLRESDTLQAGIAALSEQRRGGVRIAASLTIAEHLLPGWLAEMQRRLPDVHTALRVVNSTDVIEMVRTSQVVLGFIESPAKTAGMSSRRVGRDRLTVVVAPGHPWARRRAPLSVSALTDAAFVVREPGSGTRETFRRALGDEPRIALEAGSTSAVIGSAVSGVGPAVVSELAVRPYLESGALVDVPVALDLRRPLRAIWRADETLRPPAADLVHIAQR